jgi:replicative DNA helicase
MEAYNIWNEVAMAVLASCVHSEDGMVADYCIEEGISEKHFYDAKLAYIWEAIYGLRAENKPIDSVQVFMKLSEGGTLKVDNMKTTEVFNKVETYGNYKDYVARLKESYKLNQLRRLSRRMLEEITSGEASSELILELIQKEVREMDKTEKSLTPASVFIESAYESLTQPERLDKGIASHLHELNKYLKFKRQTLNIVAARPGLGKSSIATNIADAVATRIKESVAIFSMEMSDTEVGVRLIAARSGKNPQRIQEFANYPMEEVNQARMVLKESPIFVDDSGGQTVSRIGARCRRLQQSHGLGMVIIDYFQLISTEGSSRGMTRQQHLGEVSRGLKRMAKELDVPVLCLAQLSRDHEKQGRKPKNTDLRESGDIENDADTIVLIHQDEELRERSESLLIIGKNRNGTEGVEIPVKFKKYCTRFEDIEGGENERSPSILDDDLIGCNVKPKA